jgi:hypothetical protein
MDTHLADSHALNIARPNDDTISSTSARRASPPFDYTALTASLRNPCCSPPSTASATSSS